MSAPKKNRAAQQLGRLGGIAATEAQRAARAANGARGGRPVRLATVGRRGHQVEVHADARLVGYAGSAPLFVPGTIAARQWLSRHGYTRQARVATEVLEGFPKNGRTWSTQ